MPINDWTIDIQELASALEDVPEFGKILTSDDSDTLQTVDESVDYPLVIINFSGNGIFRNSYNTYIEGDQYVDFSLNVRLDQYESANAAKIGLRELIAKAIEKIELVKYSIDSPRINYGEGLIGGAKVMSASFTVTK